MMAAPITHIAFAELIEDKLDIKDKKAFYLGVCFPDIRLLGLLSEEESHPDCEKFENITGTDFIKGVKFHSFFDSVRKKFIQKNNLYDLCPEKEWIKESVKLLEDEVHYEKVKDWTIYDGILDGFKSEDYDLSDEQIQNWNGILKRYISQKPNPESLIRFHFEMGFGDEAAKIFNKNLVTMRENTQLISKLNELYDNFLKQIDADQ